MDKNRPVYMIGIAAQLVGIHPQTLRMYEREELVMPQRTAKETRLYSENDIELLKEIQVMTQEMGLNLAGVKLILKMKKQITDQSNLTEQMIEQAQVEKDNAYELMKKKHQEMEEEIENIKKSFQFAMVPYKHSSIIVHRSSTKQKGGSGTGV